MNEYVRRKANLHQLGFTSYYQYLRSPLWKSIRSEKLKRDPQCYGCNNRAQQVHHSTYSLVVLKGEDPRGLWSVCKGCHYAIEFTRNGHKRSPRQATDQLKRIHRMRLGFEDRRIDFRTGLFTRSKSIRARYARKTGLLRRTNPVCKF